MGVELRVGEASERMDGTYTPHVLHVDGSDVLTLDRVERSSATLVRSEWDAAVAAPQRYYLERLLAFYDRLLCSGGSEVFGDAGLVVRRAARGPAHYHYPPRPGFVHSEGVRRVVRSVSSAPFRDVSLRVDGQNLYGLRSAGGGAWRAGRGSVFVQSSYDVSSAHALLFCETAGACETPGLVARVRDCYAGTAQLSNGSGRGGTRLVG